MPRCHLKRLFNYSKKREPVTIYMLQVFLPLSYHKPWVKSKQKLYWLLISLGSGYRFTSGPSFFKIYLSTACHITLTYDQYVQDCTTLASNALSTKDKPKAKHFWIFLSKV